jgi:hypothetical protein
MTRLRRYTKEERMALDHWEKNCRMQKEIELASAALKSPAPASAVKR